MGSTIDQRPGAEFESASVSDPRSTPVDHKGASIRRRPGRGRPGELWRRGDFVRLWAAQSISAVGSQVTLLALPLVAALTLEASAFEIGVLAAAETAPFLLVGLFAGVWVDRLRRRPILIATDLGRAALLLAIPLAAWLGLLGMPLLYAVALLTGTLTLFFDVAFLSYLPALVERDELVEGNSKLQASSSTAQVVGPGLAGALVGAVGAPFALLLDAVSFVASAGFLARIRTPEPPPARAAEAHVWREIGEGLGFVRREKVLWALAACSATVNVFAWVFFAVYLLYMTRDLGLGPGAVGLVFATGGVGALIGAIAADPLRRRFGLGPTIVGAQLLFGLTGLVIPLAALFPEIALEMVVASEFLQWLTVLVADVNGVSLRQALTPERVRGRVNATMRFLIWGPRPFGSLLGGALGGVIGLAPTLVVGELGMLAAVAWLVMSPLPGMKEMPEAAA